MTSPIDPTEATGQDTAQSENSRGGGDRQRRVGRAVGFPLAACLLAVCLAVLAAEVALRIHGRIRTAGIRTETGAAPIAPGNPMPLQLRGPRYAFAADQYRIVTLGDSFTWGDGIRAHEDPWPNRLERVLQERSGRSVGVVNLAVRGFTALASAGALQEYGVPRKPQLIVYGFYINDALRNLPDGRCLLWDYEVYANLLSGPAHDWWEEHSALYARINEGWMAYQIRTDPVGWNRHYVDGTVEWGQFKEALRRMAAAGWESQAPVVIVLWPDWGVGPIDGDHYKWQGLYAKVGATAAAFDMHVLDLTPVFAATGRPPKEWCLTRNDCHPSVEAHHLAADALADFLAERGLGPLAQVAK